MSTHIIRSSRRLPSVTLDTIFDMTGKAEISYAEGYDSEKIDTYCVKPI
jgi:hypothetical protein